MRKTARPVVWEGAEAQSSAPDPIVLFQIWDLKPPLYDTTFYVIEHCGNSPATVHAARATYYAVAIPDLIQLMKEARFQDVRRIDGVFFQPIIAGHKQQ